MKKCLITFIIVIALIFPIFQVKASDITLNDLPDLPTSNKTEYYTIANTHRGITLIYYSKNEIKDYGLGVGYSSISITPDTHYWSSSYSEETRTTINIGGWYSSGTTHKVYLYVLNGNTWTYKGYDDYGANVSNSNINYNLNELQNNSKLFEDIFENNIIFSNISYYYKINNSYVQIYKYTPQTEQKDYLSYTANKASDLNNNDIYNIRINANNYNSNYKYMIKTSQEKNWTDITSNLNNEAYQYDFIIRYNTTLYMQVLDENNTILETKTHTITDLNDYGFIISHAPATDLNNRDIDVVTVDTKFIYKENYSYQYSFDNKIFYDMSLSSDNTVYYLNHALNIPIYFRVVDNSNTVIYTQNYTVDFEELNKKVNFKEKAGTSENGSKEIIITIDFNEFLKYADMYNFKIYVDNNEYDESNNLITIKMTNETFKRGINYKIYVDNLELFSYSYRVGVESGTGGGSDTDFDNTYDNVIENELKDELGNSDYTSISGMIKVVQNFINAISQFVTTFFELIMYFFNELNIWVRTCIIALFIELCVFKTIKAVRK